MCSKSETHCRCAFLRRMMILFLLLVNYQTQTTRFLFNINLDENLSTKANCRSIEIGGHVCVCVCVARCVIYSFFRLDFVFPFNIRLWTATKVPHWIENSIHMCTSNLFNAQFIRFAFDIGWFVMRRLRESSLLLSKTGQSICVPFVHNGCSSSFSGFEKF